MKTVTYLKESGLLIKGARKALEKETKEQKGWFLAMLLVIIDASLLGHQLGCKEIIRTVEGVTTTSQEWGTTRSGQVFIAILSFD